MFFGLSESHKFNVLCPYSSVRIRDEYSSRWAAAHAQLSPDIIPQTEPLAALSKVHIHILNFCAKQVIISTCGFLSITNWWRLEDKYLLFREWDNLWITATQGLKLDWIHRNSYYLGFLCRWGTVTFLSVCLLSQGWVDAHSDSTWNQMGVNYLFESERPLADYTVEFKKHVVDILWNKC